MEQLSLFESSEVQRQPRSRENVSESFRLQYEHRNGQLYQGNSIDWLESLVDGSVDLSFLLTHTLHDYDVIPANEAVCARIDVVHGLTMYKT